MAVGRSDVCGVSFFELWGTQSFSPLGTHLKGMARPYSFVNFVSGSEYLSNKPTKRRERGGDFDNGAMSGEEAKSFYESVLSSSSTRDDEGTGSLSRKLSEGYVETCGRTRKPHSRREAIREKPADSICSSQNRKETKRKKETSSTTVSRSINEFLKNAQNGNLKRLKELVDEEELDVNATDSYSWTALMCAAQEGHIDVVKFLLNRGAVWKDKRDANGRSALELAQLSGHQDIVTLLRKQRGRHNRLDTEGDYSNGNTYREVEKFWCTVCQQEFTDNQKTHACSTVHLFNCQHKPGRPFYYIPEGNVGYQMMLKSGWNEDEGESSVTDPERFWIENIPTQLFSNEWYIDVLKI